jgi:drug/metabolite transporter (DMT)-like permease
MMLWACILVRVLVNPLSNVFQKLLTGQGVPPLAVVGVTHVVLSAACLPLLLVGLPPAYFEFWLNMAICGVLAAAADVLLVKAVQLTDLSVLGPVNAYKAVVSIVPGIVLLGEVPSAAALVGIGLIVAGSYFLVDRETATPARIQLDAGRDSVRQAAKELRWIGLAIEDQKGALSRTLRLGRA